jgi:hypothetical protein
LVSEIFCGLPDARFGLGFDFSLVVKHFGHGLVADTSSLGDIFDRNSILHPILH